MTVPFKLTKVMYNSWIRLIIIIPFLAISILACQKGEVPEMLIPKEKISKILVDVHLAEASLQMFPNHERDSIARKYYGHIFRIHEVTEEKYYESIEYYTKSPQEIVEIYKVTEELLKADKPKKVDKVVPE